MVAVIAIAANPDGNGRGKVKTHHRLGRNLHLFAAGDGIRSRPDASTGGRADRSTCLARLARESQGDAPKSLEAKP